MKEPHPLGLSGLHLLLALSLPLVFALFCTLAGCKKAKEEKADLGPAYSTDAIDEALSKGLQGASLDELHVGEYLNYVILRRIENSEDVMMMGGTSVSVIDFEKEKEKYTMRINKSYRNEDGSFFNLTTEDNLVLPSPGTSPAISDELAMSRVPRTLASASLPPKLTGKAIREWAKTLGVNASDTSGGTPAYYRLVEFDDVQDPPDKVKAKPDCGGIPGCRIPIHFVQFDQAIWYSDTSYKKVSLSFGFSLSTPLIPFGENFDRWSGLLVNYCVASYVQLETRNVYVRDCQQLDDFQK